jgi:hypothetical protein
LYDEKTQTSDMDIPNPIREQHCCIVSDVSWLFVFQCFNFFT